MKRSVHLIFLISLIWGASLLALGSPSWAVPPKHDYYETLGVPRGVGQDDLRKAYRKLARANHPDLNPGDKSAEDRFKNIQEAYDVLNDPKKRQAYDTWGQKDGEAPPSVLFHPQPAPPVITWQDYLRGTSLEGFYPVAQQAVQMVAPIRKFNVVQDLPTLKEFNSPFQLEALRAVLPYRKALIQQDYSRLAQFQTEMQVLALQAVVKSRGAEIARDYRDLLEFTLRSQVISLRMVAPHLGAKVNEHYATLKRFNSSVAQQAIKAVIGPRGANIDQDLKILVKFDDPVLLERLRDKAMHSLDPIEKHYQAIYDGYLAERKQSWADKLPFDNVRNLVTTLESMQYPATTVEQEALKLAVRENFERVFAQRPGEEVVVRVARAARSDASEADRLYREYKRTIKFNIDEKASTEWLEKKYTSEEFQSYWVMKREVPFQDFDDGHASAFRKFVVNHLKWFGELPGFGLAQLEELQRKPVSLPDHVVRQLYPFIAPKAANLAEARRILQLAGDGIYYQGRGYTYASGSILNANSRLFLSFRPTYADLREWIFIPGMEPEVVADIVVAAAHRISTPEELKGFLVPRSVAEQGYVIDAHREATRRVQRMCEIQRIQELTATRKSDPISTPPARRGFWGWGSE